MAVEDKAVAQKQFALPGDDWSSGVWRDKRYFGRGRRRVRDMVPRSSTLTCRAERTPADAYTRAMDLLWTPWRYSYITGEKKPGRRGVPEELAAWPGEDQDCVFCNLTRAVEWGETTLGRDAAERAGLVVARYAWGYCCLNRFPYASGHLLLVPSLHTDSLAKLPAPDAAGMMHAAQQVETALRETYRPDGINLGMNLGQAAGAGVAEHIHLHALPRWVGDTNFMTVVAETRVLPETLEVTWARMRERLNQKEA